MTPSTFELRDFGSKFSGNTIEVCPVGALTSAKYRFRARPWDLQTSPSVCTECSNGCAIWMDHRVGKLVRVNGRTNEAVNEEWTCDRGKFGQDWHNAEKRLGNVLVREGDALVESDWPEAYKAILAAFGPGKACAALAGPKVSNEALYLAQRLFRKHFESGNLDHRFTRHLQTPEQRLESVLGIAQVQNTLASIEGARSILVFGSSIADEEPIL
jgi:NADH-quinone oxidoreductase subunit G